MRWAFPAALMLIMVLLLATNVSAATCSFNAPSADWVNITSSPYTLNITCTPANADGAIYNVTFRYSSDGTTYTTIATVQNSTSDQRTFTYSWDWSSVSDGSYYINATGYEYNVTDGSLLGTGSDQKANIGLDDTAPTVTISTYPDAVRYGKAFTINGTCSDTGFPNDECTCTFYEESGFDKAGGDSMTVSGSSISYSFTPTRKGHRKWWVTCSDAHGFSTTTSKVETVVSKSTGAGIVTGKPVTAGGEERGSRSIVDLIKAFFSWLRGLFS